ncbi:FtsK/SpoIIIE domain-containing protein [Longispora albida]|uniref:FtsK/SpoIIIE domain-containing protein n=1 Tax=Longispora albida TaxID=203523 RepID=UPI000374E295|nr:FtsK/SpoIIIE domain-containing protein [Longispora albida]
MGLGALRSGVEQAVALHRQASGLLAAVRRALEVPTASGYSAESTAEQRVIAERIARTAQEIAPGWLGGPLTADADYPVPESHRLIRVGEARPLPDASFPLLVPLLGAGHLAIDADARNPAATALIRTALLRLLASLPPRDLRILIADTATMGAATAPFRPLFESGTLPPPVTSRDGLKQVLDEAERQIKAAHHDLPYLLVVIATAPELLEPADTARIAALAHAGPAAKLHLLVTAHTGQPLPKSTQLALGPAHALLISPGGESSTIPIHVDQAPPDALIERIATRVAAEAQQGSRTELAALLPAQRWSESSRAGLRTTVGRAGRAEHTLSFDDATPHWLVGGRSGAGKTAFLVTMLYGLATRYGPADLTLYLLDFKEGVSFTEFTPTERDPSWIPHARAVGIESDREYGVAVLRELDDEMTRRSSVLKRAGVTKLADLESAPARIVCVIDEFQVLFDGNDQLARDAVALLESLARKGRSYGIHLVLASQTVSGVEALYTKKESIFGQFAARIALPGGGGVLDPMNNAAQALRLGEAIINVSAGAAGHDTIIRFPDPNAEADTLTELRHALWQARPAGSEPPSVFEGYAEQHVQADPMFQAPAQRRRPEIIVGRNVDVPGSTAAFPLDTSPGRHIAVLGPSEVGADILHAAVLGLARQHEPGEARFCLAPLVAAADPVCADVVTDLDRLGHSYELLDAYTLRNTLAGLADPATDGRQKATYLVLFGADAASGMLEQRDPDRGRSGLADLRDLLRSGPARGVHVLGWWRGLRRFNEDIGGSSGREDVACLVTLNLPGSEVAMLLGQAQLDWQYRPNRALLIDRHTDRVSTFVPYVRPGRYA